MICFYGNTGSGKSTSVNFLMGIPLRKSKNVMGEETISIQDTKFEEIKKSLQEIDSANIGYSIGTSQTIYAKGHCFIQDTLTPQTYNLTKNVVLCDNPGFKDTRGSIYDICTSMSMDMAVRNSKNIRAIILVIPYNSFLLDKANHIVSVFE